MPKHKDESSSEQFQSLYTLHRLVWTALLAALIAVGSYLHLSIGPVPISFQTLFVLLSGFILGMSGGIISVVLYILAGILGLPVFAGGTAGLGHLLGPTGGYILGFLGAAFITGLSKYFSRSSLTSWTRGLFSALLGLIPIYALGLPWLKLTLDLNWIKALSIGLLPFLPGAVLKVLLCVLILRFLQKYDLTP